MDPMPRAGIETNPEATQVTSVRILVMVRWFSSETTGSRALTPGW